MTGHDAGVEVACPRCGQIVLQKVMIPIVGEARPDGGHRVCYLCIACARALITPSTVPSDGPVPDAASADGAEPAADWAERAAVGAEAAGAPITN